MQIFTVLFLVGMVTTGVLSWVMLSSFREDTLKQETDAIVKQGTQLASLLEQADYFSTDKTLDSPWEISTCVTLMQSMYRERILFVRHDKILFDTKDTHLSDTLSNKAIADSSSVLNDKERELLVKAYEAKEGLADGSEEIISVVIPICKKQQNLSDTGFVVVRAELSSVLQSYYSVKSKVIAIAAVIAILLVVIAFWYTGRVVKPLRELLVSIERMTEGFLDEKVNMKSYAEVDDVADAINHMTTKLETLESSRQEFVSNVSHELKTPITSIKVLADSLLQQEDAPAELYREFLSDINEEIERENKIITDLLSLVKMDKTAGELNITSININELLEQILKRIRPIAAERNIELIFESYRTVMAEVDEVKLSLAVNNLIENAVKYNYDNGWVRVSLNADHKFFYVKVSDSGVGIPKDEQENVFERFYRVDKARSRETGGTGLGLSITRNAILMHRGAIKVYSKEKEGTTFTVRIPLNYVS